jgi:hypothetical protein
MPGPAFRFFSLFLFFVRAVVRSVHLSGFLGMMQGVQVMAVGGVGVVSGGAVVTGTVMLGGTAVVFRSLLVMIGGVAMMLGKLGFVRHG